MDLVTICLNEDNKNNTFLGILSLLENRYVLYEQYYTTAATVSQIQREKRNQ
jgi:hypothetical protein